MGRSAKGWLEHFSTDEIRDLRVIRDHRAWLTLLVNYGLIAASMAMVAYAPNALTVVLALFIIGTRQLGLAVVMHESAHQTLFRDRWLNDLAGNWLAAYPIYLSGDMYRTHHIEHHAKTWTEEDPDLELATPFPVSKASMMRKVARDLLGVTGFKQLVGTTFLVVKVCRGQQVDAGTLPLRLERAPAVRMVAGTLITNLVLFGLLWALGHPMLYLLWLGAWLTTNKLVARIRSIAEHAVVPDPTDPIGQTRTVRDGWLERLFIAPNRVQYHLEHHLLMTVPHYNLPRFHEMLRERGVLEDACIADNYAQVLKQAVA
ncbi:MAG: fatty acid desaturase family protein [Myxococcales bacterium]|nr:MAG: fatty acid desaturase family protein [Myxococcales bacterium]